MQSWKDEGRLVVLEEATRRALSVAVVLALGELPPVLFVQRHMLLWSLCSSDDVEHLLDRERVYASRRPIDECRPLREVPLKREALLVGHPVRSLPVAQGESMLERLRTRGYFHITLPSVCQRACDRVYCAMETFFSCPQVGVF